MHLSEHLLTLFSGRVEKRRGSYVIEIPESELRLGDVDPEEVYRVALYASPGDDEENAESEAERRHRSDPSRQPTGESGPPVTEGDVLEVDIDVSRSSSPTGRTPSRNVGRSWLDRTWFLPPPGPFWLRTAVVSHG